MKPLRFLFFLLIILIVGIIEPHALSQYSTKQTVHSTSATQHYSEPGKKDNTPIEVRLKDKIVGTIRATGMMWLPIVSTISIALMILGQTFESMQSLLRLAYRLIFATAIGYLLIFGCDTIAQIMDKIANKLDFTL